MRKLLVVMLFCLLPAVASALEDVGAGGGGWLYASEFNLANPNVALIGSDMAGFHRTLDAGQSWEPWNENFALSSARINSYVQDIQSINYNGFTGYYSATVGGIFRTPEGGGGWVEETPLANYWFSYQNYHDTGYPIFTNRNMPFACLDWNGTNLLVAGAGTNRWDDASAFNYSNSWTSYPGLADPHSRFVAGSTYPNQWTVWTKNLDQPGATWVPLSDASGRGAFGTARDITVARLGSVDHIVVSTERGIYWYNGTSWQDLHQNINVIVQKEDLSIAMITAAQNDWYGYGAPARKLAGWSVHLTARGSLYVGMQRVSVADADFPSGVYRIHLLTDPARYWGFCDNHVPVDNGYAESSPPIQGQTARMLGVKNTWWGTIKPWTHLIYASVVDGTGPNPDIVYVGCRASRVGLLRGSFPFSWDFTQASWRSLVYSDNATQVSYNYSQAGVRSVLDVGYQNFWGPAVIHRPAVRSGVAYPVAVQFNGMLHWSDDGFSFRNCYNQPAEGGLQTRGYNEMCTYDVAFDSNGRLYEANGDCGLFISVSNRIQGMVRQSIPYAAAPTSDQAWATSACAVDVRNAWHGSANPAVFAVIGDNWRGQRSRLFMRHPNYEAGVWKGISSGFDTGATYLFPDVCAAHDDTLFLAYKAGSNAGVKRGTLAGSTWTWTNVNTGLQGAPERFVYSPATGRIFVATRAVGATQGGVFMLTKRSDVTWERVYTVAGNHTSCTALAIDAAGSTLYAAFSAADGGTGGLLKCANAGATTLTWTELTLPAVLNAASIWVGDVGISPYNANTVYMALRFGFGPNVGVWQLDGGAWTNLLDGQPWYGIGCYRLAWSPNPVGRLAIGTEGFEVLTAKFLPPPPPPDPPNQGKAVATLQPAGGNAIRFSLAETGDAVLTIYDLSGRRVRDLECGRLAAGPNEIVWDGRDNDGRATPSGMYFARIEAGTTTVRTKVVRLR